MAQAMETGRLAIEKERWDAAVEVAPDFWIIATHHRPGGSRYMPEVNNRCLVFRLRDSTADNAYVLVVVNAVDTVALPLLRKLEAQTGAAVRYIVSPGGGHNLHLLEWHEEFPEAQLVVGPARIPRVAAGRKLASSPVFRVMDTDDPLPQFNADVQFVNFDGLLGFRESVTPMEGGKDSRFILLKMMLSERKPSDPIDELWLYHVPTRSVFGGENLGWRLSREQHRTLPFMMKMLFKPETVQVLQGMRGVADKDKVAANWRKILSWPAENLLSFHDTIGTGQIGGAQAALRQAVEKAGQL